MIGYREVGRPDRAASSFLGEHFPLAPDAIRAAYGQFWDATQPSYQSVVEQQLALKTTTTLVSDFCSSHLTPQAYGGAMLAPLVQAIDSDQRNYALDALDTYVNTTSESREDVLFTLGLAGDQSIIQSYQNDILDKLYPDSEQPWEQAPVGVSPYDILRIRAELGVNIESHLIAAANSLRWFLSYNASSYKDALQRARRAESLHAPMSEIISFDGMAMALQSHLSMMRLEQLGEVQYIDQARQQLQGLSSPQVVDNRVGQMLTALRGSSSHKQPLTHGERHGIMIGEGVTGPEELRTVWRMKSLGRVAEKLYRQKSLEPLTDAVGVTTITSDAYQSGQIIASALQRAHSDPRFMLRSSPKRNLPLHVRGAPEFVYEVARGMGYSGTEELRNHADVRETNADDYQVAKIAFTYQQWGEPEPINCELQTNRTEDRRAARIGTPNHAFYRLTGRNATVEEAEAVAHINSRVKFLGENGLTTQSRERAEKTLHDINAHAKNR